MGNEGAGNIAGEGLCGLASAFPESGLKRSLLRPESQEFFVGPFEAALSTRLVKMSNRLPARRREATVADVAAEAKVSKAQTARALGGYGAVSDEVRSRVLEAAELLGYRPNMLARSMNTGKSHTLGVVVGDIQNPYFSQAIRAISDTAKKAGYDVLLANTDEDPSVEVDAIQVLRDKRVDGFIVAPAASSDHSHLQSLVEAGLPLVLLDRRVRGLDVDTVTAESRRASYMATLLLLREGHERIAFISSGRTLSSVHPEDTGPGLSPVADRLAGMKEAFEREGKGWPASLIRLDARPPENVHGVVSELLSGLDRATALIASDSVIGLKVVEAIHDLGVKIPGELSFVMFDDHLWAKLLTPPLTVVAQPVYELGAAAAATLISRMRGEKPAPIANFSAKLIERESIGPPSAFVPQ